MLQLYEHYTALTSSDGSETIANILIKRLDEERRKARHTVNHLTGRIACKPVRKGTIASQLLQNGRCTNPDRDFSRQVGKEVAELWKVNSKGVNMPAPCTTEKLVEAVKSMKAGSAPGPDDIHPEFLLHAGDAATKWLC